MCHDRHSPTLQHDPTCSEQQLLGSVVAPSPTAVTHRPGGVNHLYSLSFLSLLFEIREAPLHTTRVLTAGHVTETTPSHQPSRATNGLEIPAEPVQRLRTSQLSLQKSGETMKICCFKPFNLGCFLSVGLAKIMWNGTFCHLKWCPPQARGQQPHTPCTPTTDVPM